jgi:multiple sugar transport system ATP-binding protein
VAAVTMEKLTKVYPNGVTAVAELDLEIDDGEFLVLVGPSGCGKSTALRMVAGLEEITDGVLRIGDRIVNDLVPKERDIAMVFQNYALYPHMTVAQNIGFSLKLQRLPLEEVRRRVQRAARTLQLDEWLHRKPGQLSGGQRQRVAMGRAIVRDPEAFLMTSRSRTSTQSCASRCAPRSLACSETCAPRRSTSPTTRSRP